MTRFERVKEILDTAVAGTTVHAHGPFWRGLTRDEFVQKVVFSLPLVAVNDARNSNLVHALRGEPPFGNDSGNDDAPYPRMPSGLPAVPKPDIDFIEKWIDEGCLEDLFVAPGGATPANAADDGQVHLAYWRDLDNWSLNHRPVGVEEAIGEVFSRTFKWKRAARGTAAPEVWAAAVAEAAEPGWRLLADRQAQTVRSHYGPDPDWTLVLASYAGFGAGTLPPDRLRPENPIHQMDGPGMWPQWAAFADGAVRLRIEPEFWLAMQRAILLGMLSDGFVRGRFTVEGFAGAGSAAILEFVTSLKSSDLPSELARRFVQSRLP